MTSIPVETLISKLDHWLSLLASVRSSLQTQVSLLDSALSNLNFSQPSSLAIQNISTVRQAIATQLTKVLREISDLDLVKTLLTTTHSSIGNYEHIFRLSDRRTNIRHRAGYYQELSELFNSVYNYVYRN
jgi:putative lipoic acid-binding regulatory protein